MLTNCLSERRNASSRFDASADVQGVSESVIVSPCTYLLPRVPILLREGKDELQSQDEGGRSLNGNHVNRCNRYKTTL